MQAYATEGKQILRINLRCHLGSATLLAVELAYPQLSALETSASNFEFVTMGIGFS
jgi:hypothetical protein